MTITRVVTVAGLALAIASAATLPASAVQIRKSNWAEGDPAAASVPSRGDAQRPADTTGLKTFDKRHDGAN